MKCNIKAYLKFNIAMTELYNFISEAHDVYVH